MTDGRHRIRVARCTLLDIERQFGQGTGGVASAVHGGGARMAGRADDLALVSHAAIDAGHNAQRQMIFVEHRPLLDMDLNEPQVLCRVPANVGDVIDAQTRVLHGLSHGDALSVGLLQPLRLEVAHQGARPQEGGFVALSFFLGKCHHFNPERQTTLLLRELLHTGHGHKDTQAAVVFAAIANRVVVRSGHEKARAGHGRVVAPHHIAHRVDLHVVKAAVAHPVADALCAGAVGVRQVGHRELPFLGEPRVAVLGQGFLPVPHRMTQRRLDTKFVVQADFDNAVDVAQTLLQLKCGVTPQSALKGLDDLPLVQADTARSANRENKGPAKFGVVIRVELLNVCKLFGGAVGQARPGLFIRGGCRQGLADHGLACQLGVRANQCELSVLSGRVQHLRHQVFQMRQRFERALCDHPLGNPVRVFVQPGEHACRIGFGGVVELIQREGHEDSLVKGSTGKGIGGGPVTRDVQTASHPHTLVRLDVIQKTLQGRDASRTTQQSAMHANAHHLGTVESVGIALCVQGIERVLHVLEERIGV